MMALKDMPYEAVLEAFASKAADKGTVKFSETKLTDPHIQKVLQHVSKVTGVPINELEDHIKEKEAKFKEMEKKAPILYGTIVKNIIESEVFNLLDKVGDNRLKGAPEFNKGVFLKLVSRIKAEHDQFFPLRNFVDHKKLKNERFVITPSDKPENKHLNACKTACATPKGEFAFYLPFMQKLIDFAYVKGLKGQGKKWESNGGDIPDEYVYIEFLIIHELMHFTYADFHYHKIYKVSNKIINWVGDFRTNYLLVKSGYHQLPMGLFNDDINYDRQKSYKEMIDAVKAEFDKLNKDEQEKAEEQLDDQGDDHDLPQEGDPQEGDGKGKPKESDEGDAPEEGDGSEGDAEGPEGKDKGKSKSGDGEPEISEEDVEAKHKEISEKMSKKGDKGAEDMKPKEGKGKGSGSSGTGPGGQGAGTNGSEKFDYANVKPKFNWKQLLHKLLTEVETETEETYNKPSRSSIRNLHLARQTGAGAVKPGEIESETQEKIKIAFVVDSSGSMTSSIAKVYANIENVFKTDKKLLSSDFYLVKFSADHTMFRCNFKNKTYQEIKDVKDKTSTSAKNGSLKTLFTEHYGSSTNFNEPLIEDLLKLNALGFNIILITDSDIIGDGNKENFFKLYSRSKKNLYILADSRSSYGSILKAMNQISKNITYIDD